MDGRLEQGFGVDGLALAEPGTNRTDPDSGLSAVIPSRTRRPAACARSRTR
ncbi:hypothetical protein AB0F18_14505 [Streptomyces sp. NPDC029216]|uniref:hypothetical protein n=1 Tax=Streptomyces sp. NPDC029216 TaxID=3154701 RepID=UPI00340B4A82